METDVSYELDDFLTYSKQIKNDIESIRTSLQTFSAEVTNSSDYWTGGSHDAFLNSYNSILSQYNEFLGKLDLLADNLTTINALYSAHETNTSNI